VPHILFVSLLGFWGDEAGKTKRVPFLQSKRNSYLWNENIDQKNGTRTSVYNKTIKVQPLASFKQKKRPSHGAAYDTET
jgi:hypothetical protein